MYCDLKIKGKLVLGLETVAFGGGGQAGRQAEPGAGWGGRKGWREKIRNDAYGLGPAVVLEGIFDGDDDGPASGKGYLPVNRIVHDMAYVPAIDVAARKASCAGVAVVVKVVQCNQISYYYTRVLIHTCLHRVAASIALVGNEDVVRAHRVVP